MAIILGMGEQPAPPVEVTEADVEFSRGWSLYQLGAPDSACGSSYQAMAGWYAACAADSQAAPLLDLSDVRWDNPYDDNWEVGL